MGTGEWLGIVSIIVTVVVGIPAYFLSTRKKRQNQSSIQISGSNVGGDVVGGDKNSLSKEKK